MWKISARESRHTHDIVALKCFKPLGMEKFFPINFSPLTSERNNNKFDFVISAFALGQIYDIICQRIYSSFALCKDE